MDIQFIIISFVAGVLTILAPCIFPLLPILLGSSADIDKQHRNRAFSVITALLVSITVLTILIHGASSLIAIDQGVLRAFSAGVLLVIGLITIFPSFWEQLSAKLKLSTSSNKWLGKAMSSEGRTKDIMIGIALGPVFSSCSPTYGVIIATILPQTFFSGLWYLLWYVLGLGLIMAMIAILGQKFTAKLAWATDPNGWFKRIIGVLFVVIGVAIIFNLDKSFEELLLQFDFYDRLVEFEINLLN